MTCPNNWKQLCLETSTTIPIDISSKILQDNWLNAKERELKYNARQKNRGFEKPIHLKNLSLHSWVIQRKVNNPWVFWKFTLMVQPPLQIEVDSEQQQAVDMEDSESSELANVRS